MKILPINMQEAKERDSSFFIELYNIYLRTGVIRICNCDEIITFNHYQYYPVPVERGSIKTSVDSKIDNMDLKISDADKSKVGALINGFDFRGRIVEIFRINYPESLEDSSIWMPVFRGKIDAPSYTNGEFSCTLESAFPQSKVPMRTTQYFCNHTFGDSLCTMNKRDIQCEVIGVLSSNEIKIRILSNGMTISKNQYEYGVAVVGFEAKMIESNTEDSIKVKYPFVYDVHIGDKVMLSLNCNKTPELCAKYNNRQHYGGFLAIPKEFRIIS